MIFAAIAIWWYMKPFDGDINKDIIVRIRKDQLPMSHNPLLYFKTDTLKLSEIGAAISECVFDGLYNRTIDSSNQLSYEKGLAKRLWTEDSKYGVSKTWYIELKEKYWHGTNIKVTPLDIIHTYDCIDKGGSESPWRERLRQSIRELPPISPSETKRIEIVFNTRMAKEDVVQLLTFKIIPQVFYYKDKKIKLLPGTMMNPHGDKNWKIFNQNPIGTGPYRINQKKSSDDRIVLEKDTTNTVDNNIPEHVIFRELSDEDLLSAIGKKINFLLYIPAPYRNEITGNNNFSNYQYTPFYFYAIVFGKDISEESKNQIYSLMNENTKSNILSSLGIKNDNTKYINNGPFPWNWKIFIKYNKRKFSLQNVGEKSSKNSFVKHPIKLICNRNDIRTKDLTTLISNQLRNKFSIEITEMPETKFMTSLKNKKYQLALIIWEGFDQDYSISKLYTEEGNPLNIISLDRTRMPYLNSLFDKLITEKKINGCYTTAGEIHKLINSEKPYIFLFTPPRTAAYINKIDGIEEFPVHPETFLPNIKYWKMR